MRTATDMGGVKSIAKMLLSLDITKTKFSPAIVRHPFTNSGITMRQAESGQQWLNLCESPEDLAHWRGALSQAIDKAENPWSIYMMLNTPYTLTFLKYAEPYLSTTDFSELLSASWIMTEYANSDAEVSKKQLVKMFKRTDPTALMEEDELEQFASLDDVVTVYRGVTSHNAKNVRALSWTLDRETAEWFAHRFDEDGTVYEAQIDKAHIFALFSGRNESEVVLDPKYLRDIAPAQVQSFGMEQSM